MTTETLPTIQAALAAVMNDVQVVAKKDRNEHHKFLFRGIDAVINAVGPALRTHNVIVMPHVEDFNYTTTATSNGKPTGHVTVKVRYRFTGPAGDFMDSVVVGESMDLGDKATPKAMSVAFRTALLQALALPTDEVDPDAHSYERSTPPPEPVKHPLNDKGFQALLGAMNHAADISGLETTAKHANTFNLSEEQRNQLKALYIERKALLEPPAETTTE